MVSMGEGKWRNLIVESVLSLYCVMAVMVLVPYIFSIGTEQRRAEYGVIAVSLVGGLMLLAVLLAVLRLIGLKYSNFDDPMDQINIRRGIEFYNETHKNK